MIAIVKYPFACSEGYATSIFMKQLRELITTFRFIIERVSPTLISDQPIFLIQNKNQIYNKQTQCLPVLLTILVDTQINFTLICDDIYLKTYKRGGFVLFIFFAPISQLISCILYISAYMSHFVCIYTVIDPFVLKWVYTIGTFSRFPNVEFL